MSRLWRALVLCILAVALPLQGVAAATMLHCAAGRVHDVAAHVHEAAAHDHHAASSGSIDKAHSSGVKQTCSACAACCMGLALIPRYSPLPADEPASQPQPAVEKSPVSFISSGLERPPRSPLA